LRVRHPRTNTNDFVLELACTQPYCLLVHHELASEASWFEHTMLDRARD